MSTGPKAADIARDREERLRKEMGDEAYETLQAEVMPTANVPVPETRVAPSLRVHVPAREETPAANEPASAMSRRIRRKKSKKKSLSDDPDYISTRLSDQSMMSEPAHPEKKRKLLTGAEPLQEQALENEQDQDDDMDLEDVPAEPRAEALDVPANVPGLQQTPTEPKRLSITRSENAMNASPIDISPSGPQPTPAQARINLDLLSRASRVPHDVGEQVKARLSALLGKEAYDQFILDAQRDTGILPTPAAVVSATMSNLPSLTGHVHGDFVPRAPGRDAPLLGSHPVPVPTEPGPSLSMRAAGQVDLPLNPHLTKAMEQLQPVGWPPEEDLYSMTVDSLCIYWIKANESSVLSMTREIQVTAVPTLHKIPKPLLKKWNELYIAYAKAQRLGRTMPFEGVRNVNDFDIFWKQRMRPPGVVEALMSYNPGPDMSLPQWPRLTAQNLLDVFPRLGNAENPIVQQHIRDYLQCEPDYPVLLVEAWEMFDTLRVIAEQPPVAMEDFKELRLEHDLWLPGAEPFRYPNNHQQPATRPPTNTTLPVQRGTTMQLPLTQHTGTHCRDQFLSLLSRPG